MGESGGTAGIRALSRGAESAGGGVESARGAESARSGTAGVKSLDGDAC